MIQHIAHNGETFDSYEKEKQNQFIDIRTVITLQLYHFLHHYPEFYQINVSQNRLIDTVCQKKKKKEHLEVGILRKNSWFSFTYDQLLKID